MTNSSLEVGDLRKILNRSKITPTHLFGEHGEDSARVVEAGSQRTVGGRSSSSSLANQKLNIAQKRRLGGGGASSSQLGQYGLGSGSRRGPFVAHQHRSSLDLGQRGAVASSPLMPPLRAATNQQLDHAAPPKRRVGNREGAQYASPMAVHSAQHSLISPNVAVDAANQKAITPQLTASLLEKPNAKG